MNKDNYGYHPMNAPNNNAFALTRAKLNYCRIILLTSLFWVLVDAFVILYFTDCGTPRTIIQQQPCDTGGKHNQLPEGLVRSEHVFGEKAADYDDELKHKNERLHNVHRQKAREKASSKEPAGGQAGFMNRLKQWFREDGSEQPSNPSHWPGENGRAVVIPDHLKEEAKRRFPENQFNIVASDIMALNRSVPDQRSSSCKSREYPFDLPTTSIIIVYHNEGNSTLLRGLVSIVRKSPTRYLKEIILVDDMSVDRDYLHGPLDEFVKTLPVPVKIFRNTERLGLMRSRLRGADAATGDTMTFLDAHIEATDGWLTPLLNEIKLNRKTIPCPVIDVISDDTFEYRSGSEMTYGGFDSGFIFDWIPVPDREDVRRNHDRSLPVRKAIACPIIDVISDENFAYLTGSETTYGGFNEKLNFRWYPAPERENRRRGGDKSLAMRTPTMAGGLFTIDREYFYELGAYDEGMDVWGAENLEMSFRIWMCGGTLLILPCSHVGHVFRKQTPYKFPGGTNQVIFRNNRRLIDVWTDEYSNYFHKIIPELNGVEAGDLSKRIELRKTLNCKSFKWYLDNIYPEAPIPIDFFHVGSIVNTGLNFCLDNMGRKGGEDAGATYCHSQGGNQIFEYSKSHNLVSAGLCLDTNGAHGVVKMNACNKNNKNQKWDYDNINQFFRNRQIDACLAISETNNIVLITMYCDPSNNLLKWTFKDPLFSPAKPEESS